MKYRKKPVTIEAYQTDVDMDIPTLEGTMHASVGDYIITGVRGEQYPCKPDIFLETYEPAEGDSDHAPEGETCRGECRNTEQLPLAWSFTCSECGVHSITEGERFNFCPNCGGKVVDG